MTRLEANREILAVLSNYLESNPDLRFGQALTNLNIASHLRSYAMNENKELEVFYDDIFFQESSDLSDRLNFALTRSTTDKTQQLPSATP